MGVISKSYQCSTCQRPTLHQRPNAAHLIHFILTLITCGGWLPIWLIAGINKAMYPYRCQSCGETH